MCQQINSVSGMARFATREDVAIVTDDGKKVVMSGNRQMALS